MEEGKFIFPSLVVGDYYLGSGSGNSGDGTYSHSEDSSSLSIQEGEKKEIDIGVVEAASIREEWLFLALRKKDYL